MAATRVTCCKSGPVAVLDVKIAVNLLVDGYKNPGFESLLLIVFAGDEPAGTEEDVCTVDFARDAEAGYLLKASD